MLDEAVAALESAAIRPQKNRPRGGVAAQPRRPRQRISEIVLDEGSVARERDRRRDQLGKREAP